MEKAIQDIANAIKGLAEPIRNLKPDPSWLSTGLEIITAAGVIFGIYKILVEFRKYKENLREEQKQREREDIRDKLNLFFGPLKEMGTESIILYHHLAPEEKEKAKNNNEPRWRALRHLASGKKLDPRDSAILEQIMEITKKQLDLVEKEGQIVENSQLALLLGRFGAHVRLLSLAAEGKLVGYENYMEDIVFPKELNGAIESEIRKLQDRYKELDPDNKGIESATLVESQKQITSFYDKNSQEYYRKTAYNDLSHLYRIFLKDVPYGGFIIDAGCGIGRDTRYFIEQGRVVISFDASEEMVRMCRQYPFAYCLKSSFSDINYLEEFDGVWACASLIHLSESYFKDALYRLSKSLKPCGIMFFSLKKKNGQTTGQKEPEIYFYDDIFINKIMVEDLGFERIEPETVAKEDDSEFAPYFYRKPNSKVPPTEF